MSQAVAVIFALACSLGATLPGLTSEWLLTRPRQHGLAWDRCAQGELVERQLDTNGDGRPDVAEYYSHGALLRRASDRNFNGVTDLVEDFDPATQRPTRSIVDEDYDGTADLLLLFRDGKLVVTEATESSEAGRVTTVGGNATAHLASLRNPFGAQPALEAPFRAVHDDTWLGSGRADAVIVHLPAISRPLRVIVSRAAAERLALASLSSLPSPRGPPKPDAPPVI